MRLRLKRYDRPMRWRNNRRDIQFVANALSYHVKPMTRDETLAAIAAARAGDKSARDEIVLRNKTLAHYVIRRYMSLARAIGLAVDDLAQECMIALIKAADTYDPDRAAWSTYAVRCMGNRLHNYIAKQARHTTSPLDGPADTLAYNDDALQAVEDADHNATLSRMLRRVLVTLPAEDCEVVMLYYGMDNRTRGKHKITRKDVADITGRSIGYVSTHLHHARERLRRTIPQDMLDMLDK